MSQHLTNPLSLSSTMHCKNVEALNNKVSPSLIRIPLKSSPTVQLRITITRMECKVNTSKFHRISIIPDNMTEKTPII
jgi:hypothetical protein